MTAPVDRVIDALTTHGCDPRRNGTGWSARCPAHDDKNPSLSVSEGDNGGALVHCHAGNSCAPEAITAAVGLTMGDLRPEKASNGNGRNGHRPEIATTYPYVDATGRLLFEVVRLSPKGFRQRRPDGKGGWEWNLKGVESRPLYRLPKVLAAVAANQLVWVTEGEKDADRLQAALPDGEVATTCPGGAGKWRDEHTAALAGTEVMVVADRDGPGRKHAREVADALEVAALGEVTIVEPVEGKDAADHLAAGHGPDDFQRLTDDQDEAEDEAPAPNPIVSRIRQITEAATEDQPAPLDDEAFWDALPALAHIRTFARAQLASPWATFGVIAARVICQVPPTVTLPPIIFGHASLNLTVALVGASGGGKGGTEAVGTAALRFPGGSTFERHTLGTGHAIAHGFGHWDKTAGTVERHATSVLFTVQEVDHIAGHANMSGSTTLAELRRFAMGENLGSFYVDPSKRVEIPAHTYRGAIIVGVQPDRAAVLLEDAGGGTPQRFLWLPTTDPAMPDQAPDRPNPLDWTAPRDLPAADPHTGLRPIPVCDTAADAIRQAHRDHMKGDGDPLDGHALLTRERTAATLALLDGRYGITDHDWDLAATVMAVSDHTRGAIVNTLQAKARAANQNRGRAAAELEDARDQHHSARVARRIGTTLQNHTGWMTGAQLRKTLASRDRAVFETAIDSLRHAGQIDAEEIPGQGQPGWHYRTAKP